MNKKVISIKYFIFLSSWHLMFVFIVKPFVAFRPVKCDIYTQNTLTYLVFSLEKHYEINLFTLKTVELVYVGFFFIVGLNQLQDSCC